MVLVSLKTSNPKGSCSGNPHIKFKMFNPMLIQNVQVVATKSPGFNNPNKWVILA